MTTIRSDRVDYSVGYRDEMVAAGVPWGVYRPGQSDIRNYPQIKPIVIDWIRNYRTRIPPGYGWWDFIRVFNAITSESGEQPEVTAALIAEFRNLLDIDFKKIVPPEQCTPEYKGSYIANFSRAITYAAGPGDYDSLRELFFDPKARPECWVILREYFGRSENKDLPNVLTESFKSILRLPAAHICSLRGFTEFLPEVREVARLHKSDPDIEWKEQTSDDLHRLEKKHYANTHKASSIDDFVRDLEDESVAPYAAYFLGVRKDPAALEPLRGKTTSPSTRLRQEAKTAVKKIEKRLKP